MKIAGQFINGVTDISLNAGVSYVPQVELTVNAFPQSLVEVDGAMVGIIFEPQTVSDAAEVIDHDLKQRGQWYKTIRSKIIKCMQKHDLQFDDTDYASVADDFIDNHLIGENI